MWQIIPAGNRIFIRPMDDDLITNMTVITNLREYTFDIKSVAENSHDSLYVVQFRYPGDVMGEDAPMPAAAMADENVSLPTLDTQRTQDMNEHYTYTGPDPLAPAQVFDNGKQTIITYDRLPSPLPTPLTVTDSGQPVRIAYKVVGNKMILGTVLGGFILKSPGGDITVYNELLHN
jgi:type IV secretion system protein VirB9